MPEPHRDINACFWPMMQQVQTILSEESDGDQQVSGFLVLCMAQTLAQIAYNTQWDHAHVVAWLYTQWIPQTLKTYDDFPYEEAPDHA